MTHVDIERYVPALTRFAISLTRNGDAANDLVQDTILKVLSRDARDEVPDNPKGYLMSVLHNQFIDGYRKQKRRAHVPIDDVNPVAPDASQNLSLASKEVMEVVSQLPPDFSDVLLRHARDDQSYAQIARDLSLPIGTVMSRISRARSSLRAMLNKGAPAGAGWDMKSTGGDFGDTGF